MIACRSCGAVVGDTDAFCPQCGADLAAAPVAMPSRQGRSLLATVGGLVVAGIVVASVLLRGGGPVARFADPAVQREAVERFDEAVVAGRWTRVHSLVAEPPTHDANAFAAVMLERVREQGRITRLRIDAMRLRRSRSVPLLEVRQTATVDGRTQRVVSFYVWHEDRWLYAFGAGR